MSTYTNPFVNAEKPTGVQYTITATATALNSSSILGDARIPPARITVKNASGAANACYLGGPDVANTPANALVQLEAGAAFTFRYQHPSTIYIVGTANAANIAFIEAEYTDRKE